MKLYKDIRKSAPDTRSMDDITDDVLLGDGGTDIFDDEEALIDELAAMMGEDEAIDKAYAARCPWPTKPLDIAYHDAEWGVPVHDDRVRFEFLTLEGAQAGLSWSTVLARREGYRQAFSGWDVEAISRFTAADVERLLADPGIIRHRAKVASTITNAQAFLRVQHEFGSFDAYVWRFVRGAPLDNRRASMRDVPSKTAESDALSKDLLKRGFKFVGSTICYAYMQATGLVNDHLVSCPRHAACRPVSAESA